MVHKEKALLAKVKKLSKREKLAFFGILLAYLRLIGVLKLGKYRTTPKGTEKVKGAKRAYRMTPARKAALRKAIHANQQMKPAAKRKALAKLR
jgi:hypothetical protein